MPSEANRVHATPQAVPSGEPVPRYDYQKPTMGSDGQKYEEPSERTRRRAAASEVVLSNLVSGR